MVITPNSKVKLIKNPLKLDSNNEMMFDNATAQYNYFTSLPKLEFENLTYVRKDDVLRIPTDESGVGTTYEKLLQYNFCMYQNTAFGNKWFYAFIDDIKWINPSLTEVHLKTAYYQTWQFDLVFKDSFIEREHVDDDTIGKHTLPEGLEIGEPVQASDPDYLQALDTCYICIGMTDMPPAFQHINKNRIYNGIYSGLTYMVFHSTTDASNWILACDEAGRGEAINCLFMIPSELTGTTEVIHGTMGSYTFDFYWVENSNTADVIINSNQFTMPGRLGYNYLPINNKLFTYPYNYLVLTNNCGVDITLRYEDFEDLKPTFSILGAVSPGCSIKCVPKNYKLGSDTSATYNSFNFGITGPKYPICSWNSDVYTNWLTQNSVNIGLSQLGQELKTIGSIATGNIGGTISGILGVAGVMEEKNRHSMIPDQAKGNVNSGDVTFASGNSRFTIYYMSARDEYLKCCDDYFSMFGYKVNRLGTPHLHVRTYYDYCKTIDVNIEGNVPEMDLEEIRKMFNNGIRFWHNTTYYLNFSVNNTIIS